MTAREDKEKLRYSRENLSKFFYDLAKATFHSYGCGRCSNYVFKGRCNSYRNLALCYWFNYHQFVVYGWV